MSDDLKKTETENDELRKDTENLQTKYDELSGECDEKLQLMSTQIENQGEKQDTIETSLQEQIDKQVETIRGQITLYEENIATKKEEEKQIVAVLKQYRERWGEFEKAVKNARVNEKRVVKELNNLKKKKKQLEDTQTGLTKKLGNKKFDDVVGIAEEMSKIEEMGQEWEAEKEGYQQ